MEEVLELIRAERGRQEIHYGHVNDKLIDGTGPELCWLPFHPAMHFASNSHVQEIFRRDYEEYEQHHGLPTWMHLVREEVAEAFQESDPDRLAEELIQVAALCVSWVERIRAR
jgi:hypothetical protein